jgi:signal transduction histidine kinase
VNNSLHRNAASPGPVQKLTQLLAAPIVEPSQRAARIQTVEKDIILPLRVLIIAILSYYFFFSGWFDTPVTNPASKVPTIRAKQNAPGAPTAAVPGGHPVLPAGKQAGTSFTNIPSDIASTTAPPEPDDQIALWCLNNASLLRVSFVFYAVLSLVVGATFIFAKHVSLGKIQWIVFSIGVLDAAIMGTLTFITGGFDSYLYWVFLVLIVHNAMAIPVAFPQLLLNFVTSIAFVTGGVMSRKMLGSEETSLQVPVERMIVLVAWALCCYGIQFLFEKQKRAEAEATEFAVRQERLRTAGRLAAEIAHQIKNPLSIITNAAFCLQRAVREGEMSVDEQIQIIREEVDRADQIITELMGYAQLVEGKVERLEVREELDNAIQEVFPPAARYQVRIDRDYAPALPTLLMQKRHLSGVLVNLLQNAREAMNGHGQMQVSALYGQNDTIRIVIEDNGPGIAPDKIDKIFEAYFTTREKGTGLGLAIVKHNTEMYGGAISVESELGKGTRFAVEFPARILMRLSK